MQAHPPVLHFAILHAWPPRRSLGALPVEISPAPTRDGFGFPNNPLSSRVWLSDTTCTARSGYFDHVCHLHSKAAYDGSLQSAR